MTDLELSAALVARVEELPIGKALEKACLRLAAQALRDIARWERDIRRSR